MPDGMTKRNGNNIYSFVAKIPQPHSEKELSSAMHLTLEVCSLLLKKFQTSVRKKHLQAAVQEPEKLGRSSWVLSELNMLSPRDHILMKSAGIKSLCQPKEASKITNVMNEGELIDSLLNGTMTAYIITRTEYFTQCEIPTIIYGIQILHWTENLFHFFLYIYKIIPTTLEYFSKWIFLHFHEKIFYPCC